ncbi:hypothetical protein R75461_07868 [Paraburkholderia nemoris]|nr:hypothetical protein R75461_07868 [Paraburkholderia nemoris]
MPEIIPLVSPVDGLTEITLREPTVDEIAKVNDDATKFGNVRAMKNLIASMAKIEVATHGIAVCGAECERIGWRTTRNRRVQLKKCRRAFQQCCLDGRTVARSVLAEPA